MVPGHATFEMTRPRRAVEEAAVRLVTVVAAVAAEPSDTATDLLPVLPDAVEALLALDRTDEAEPLVDALEGHARRSGRAGQRAVALRCRALLQSAAGASDDALDLLRQAVAVHVASPEDGLELARTLLARGRLERRCNKRRAAHASLTEAASLFQQDGAPEWAAEARAELDRLGQRPGTGDELTPRERQVAEFVATGRTVRETAATLFMSPKTVEAHLTRIYRKLQIRSRAELGRWIVQQQNA